jgi:hypothetical protein
MNQEALDEWQEVAASSVSLADLDAMVDDYKKKREEYEAAKKVSSELYKIAEEAENKIVSTLKAANKKSYKVDGIGTVTRVEKLVVTVPKDLEAKRSLFSWIKNKYGVDTLDDMISINHQKLNGFYNEEVDKHKDDPLFKIDGLDEPTAVESLSFRKS